MIKTADINNEIIDLSNEMVLVDNVNLPFSSLLLKKGTEKIGSVITSWKYEKLDSSKGTALEGADITTYQNSDRKTGDKNICQIISKSVNISGTANEVQTENIGDLFAHEVNNRIIESKRDLEYYLINGVYTEENGTTARQMKGLVNFATKDNTIQDTALSYSILQEMSKKMRKAGTSSQNLVLLCDYNNTDAINTLFLDKQRYTNVQNTFGSVVNRINLTYASADVYTVDTMPTNTCMLVNLDYLKLAELRQMQYNDLAKTGDSRKGFVVMENTLKVLNPAAITMFKVKTA